MQVISCGSSGIPHHAVGGSAAPLSELSLVLEEWCASSLPELCTQVGFVLVCFKWNDQKHHCGCVCLLCPLKALTHSWLIVLCSCLSFCRKAVSYYDLLGVKPDASLEEIKNAFFEKSKKVGRVFICVARGGQHSFSNISHSPLSDSCLFLLQIVQCK